MKLNAREAALQALIACRREGAWSEGALKELLGNCSKKDAALASRLCYGVLQNRLLIDFWLSHFVKGKLQPVVRDILRLAVYQLRFLDKIPGSAAVNEAVEQTKAHANFQAARLVNGVLRSMLREETWPEPKDLATKYSHPQELTELFLGEFGEEKTEALLKSHNMAPPTYLQVNTLLADLQQVKESIEAQGGEVNVHPWLSNCLSLTGGGNLEELEAFQKGWVYPQDAAAKLAVLASGVAPGMKVLDCCAAPGGKSFAAAIQMENRGELISCDIHPHKLKLIEKSAARLGISILTARLQDASQMVDGWKGAFDAVIADVPCSGLGVIRKKPDIRYKNLSGRQELMALQRDILAVQAGYVRPGGVLLFSTCTILKDENEESAELFLKEHLEFSLEEVLFPENSHISAGAMTTLLPCDHDTDGFFICKFRRKP